MFPRNLILIRHAQCISNRCRTRIDANLEDTEAIQLLRSIRDEASPLTELGIQHAKALGPVYYEAIFGESRRSALFFCSPYRRTIETAIHLTSEWQRPATDWQSSEEDSPWPQWHIDANLSERSWGEANGISWRQYKELHAPHASDCDRNPLQHLPPFTGAESLVQVRSLRVTPFLDMLKRICDGSETVVVVTHFDWILSCRSIIEQIDPFRFRRMYSATRTLKNLDCIWYSTETDAFGIARADWPQRFAVMHFSDLCENPETVQETNWEVIQQASYSTEDLRTFLEQV